MRGGGARDARSRVFKRLALFVIAAMHREEQQRPERIEVLG